MSLPVRLCVVIVNYKTARLVLACIESLRGQLDPGVDRVVVADNASGGDEVAVLARGLRAAGLEGLVEILPCAENRGFSAGNNAGLRHVDAACYLLTNSDTLFRPGAVTALLDAAHRHPEAGLVSPRIEFENGGAQVSCFRFPTPVSETIRSADTGAVTRLAKGHEIPLPVSEHASRPPWTSFASVLLRREALEAIGPLDEGFFMYYEDVDYCRRARDRGWDILNWPAARVVHLNGQSSDIEQRKRDRSRLPAYHYRSRARYFRKHHGRRGLLLANLCWLAGRAVSLPREAFLGKARGVYEREAFDIWMRADTGRR
jgi:N-acetylglucosaminyl-diphospho-decaprenol L-rhamnosyltransferase